MSLCRHEPQLLRKGPGEPWEPGARPPETPASQQQADGHAYARPEPGLVCAACHAAITRHDAAIEVNGAHAHTFLNPAGEVYRIRCFSSAPGALSAGEESDYWTWFAGHRWQACFCHVCLEHLGWRFTGTGAPFFGLIHERILDSSEPQ